MRSVLRHVSLLAPSHLRPLRLAGAPALALAAFAGALAIPGCSAESSCVDLGTCTESVSPDGGPADPKDSQLPAPSGCDPNMDAKDAPACAVNEYAVFVDGAAGDNSNPGTREAPVKTIAAALFKSEARPRIYVCGEGPYEEGVVLTKPVSLFGGFDCASWGYAGTKAKVAPTAPGYALEVAGVKAPIVIADFELTAKGATEQGASSVAVFLKESAGVTLRRVDARAGDGERGADGPMPPTNRLDPEDLKGKNSAGSEGGKESLCRCRHHGSSTGGKGGSAGNPTAQGGDDGTAEPPTDGKAAGGEGKSAANCGLGDDGRDGAARAAGMGAERHGTLTVSGWSPEPGTNGEAGNPGTGGGGGGGGASAGGGGGACGGCGGSGGIAGQGGGASIALLAFQTVVRLDAVSLHAGDGGAGGRASDGEAGAAGGDRGRSDNACHGGAGGGGAGGGGGGGGAGGVSAGILRVGGTLEGSPQVTLGAGGSAGAGGGGGGGGGSASAGSPGSNGVGGASEAILVLE